MEKISLTHIEEAEENKDEELLSVFKEIMSKEDLSFTEKAEAAHNLVLGIEVPISATVMLQIVNELSDDVDAEDVEEIESRSLDIWEAAKKESDEAIVMRLRAKSFFLRSVAEQAAANEMEKRWRKAAA
ncbi:MAG: hypothetical protein HYY55_02090 [Candidatus Niyogibacteria bacterium]|nr:MAG: hypothetical protein HYY55_02090 [Candidatus Niyogibacteria bacterium]